MIQQAADVPRSVQIISRYRTLIGFAAIVGLAVGALFAVLNPPRSTSQAFVAFTAPSCPAGAICGGPMFSPGYIEGAVLKASPQGVQIAPVSGSVVEITGVAGSPVQAAAAADTAANTYVADAGTLTFLGEQPTAKILSTATVAGVTPLKQVLDDALLGAVAGLLIGAIAALAGGQSTIDPPGLPAGYDIGGPGGGAGRRSEYGMPLDQLARNFADRKTALDD